MMEEKTGPIEPVETYCSSCWKDRLMTTNGKCRVCGTDLVKRHWKTTIKKLEIISSLNDVTSVEIKGRFYVIPNKIVEKFRNLKTYPEKVKFIEYIKESCKNYKL